ncbi:hypothetical protein AAFF_G00278270 [Aldrovandia affinis]|uniref:Uncharacterized protein n=1 Tax=Aldrovandia affinis TaxID=143900 RepID=A0AAD7SS85_9TELE|nr:hypothetical protein AAFF_G00278270 [Aldrovandia affinis]
MNWQHATMYLFFGLAGAMTVTVHATSSAPLALDRMLLAIAFFTEGVPLLLPPPRSGHAGRARAPAAALRHFRRVADHLLGGVPTGQHPAGVTAGYTLPAAGELVLADRLCAVPPQWPSRVGPEGPQQHDVHHHVLLLALCLRPVQRICGLLHCVLGGALQGQEGSANGDRPPEGRGDGTGVRG